MLSSSPAPGRSTLTLSAVLVIATIGAASVDARPARQTGRQGAEPSEKEARTPAQRKINSQLLYEIYRRRGESQRKGVPPGPTTVDIDARDRALIDVRAEVSTALQNSIRTLGGVIVSVSSEHRSIIARVPILKLEQLAGDPAVRFIEPAAEARTSRRPAGVDK